MYLQHQFLSSGNLSAVNSYRGCYLLAKYLLLLLCSPITLMEHPLHLSAALHSQQVCSGSRENAGTHSPLSYGKIHMLTHNLPVLHTCLHKCASTKVDVNHLASADTQCFCLDKLSQLFSRYKKYLVMFLNLLLAVTPECSAVPLVWALKTISCHVTPKAP